MNYLGIAYSLQNLPPLDSDFIPFGVWAQAYLKEARRPFSIAVERPDGQIHVHRSFLRDETFAAANACYVERLVKLLLWAVGGFRAYLTGCDELASALQTAYAKGGKREFDAFFVHTVYGRDLEICLVNEQGFPAENEGSIPIGGHPDGCRIGFDAGGSDRKVCAVIDGEVVYAEEVVWSPKLHADPQYHYNEILTAFRTAAAKLPRVDAIGVSSAGVVVGNSPLYASLFQQVPRERYDEVRSLYTRAAAAIGDVPVLVANDGDVAALAGAMQLQSGCVLGIAMGTSEAGGYIDSDGNLLGWLNELAFAPVDLAENAASDEWSGDRGVGCKYFSQDAVIKLANAAGISLAESLSPAEKLNAIQKLAEGGHTGAQDIFRSIGAYLAHTLVLYRMIYDIRYLLLLGRVLSGIGGELIARECKRILQEEYPDLAEKITIILPDEKLRRVGQSIAAASLPKRKTQTGGALCTEKN